LSWLSGNPDGYVVNTLKSASGNASKSDERFTRIHRATCKTINPLLLDGKDRFHNWQIPEALRRQL
jgi:hypothetical protein